MLASGKYKLIAGLIGVIVLMSCIYGIGSYVTSKSQVVSLPSSKDSKATFYEVQSKQYYENLAKEQAAAADKNQYISSVNSMDGKTFNASQQQVMSSLQQIMGQTLTPASVAQYLGIPNNYVAKLISDITPGAIGAHIKYNVWTSAIVGESLYERGTDPNNYAANNFNNWGGQFGKTSNPYVKGYQNFGGHLWECFPSVFDFAMGFGWMLNHSPYSTYKAAGAPTPQDQLVRVCEAGYDATSDPNHSVYVVSCENMINTYHLTKLDALADKVKSILGNSLVSPGSSGSASKFQQDFPGWNIDSLQDFLSQQGVNFSSLPKENQQFLQASWQYVGDPYLFGGGHGGWGGTKFTMSAINSAIAESGATTQQYMGGLIQAYDGSVSTGTQSNPIGGAYALCKDQPGYDCSGYVSQALHDIGKLSSPEATGGLAQTLPSISKSQLKAGDIIECDNGNHVAIYIATNSHGTVVLQAHKGGYNVGPGYAFGLSSEQCFGLPS